MFDNNNFDVNYTTNFTFYPSRLFIYYCSSISLKKLPKLIHASFSVFLAKIMKQTQWVCTAMYDQVLSWLFSWEAFVNSFATHYTHWILWVCLRTTAYSSVMPFFDPTLIHVLIHSVCIFYEKVTVCWLLTWNQTNLSFIFPFPTLSLKTGWVSYVGWIELNPGSWER